MSYPQTCSKEIVHARYDILTNPVAISLSELLNAMKELPSRKLDLVPKALQFKIFELVRNHSIDFREYLQHEGFWCEIDQKNGLFKEFPFPVSGTSDPEGLLAFIEKLKRVEATLKPQHYMGYSKCRLCGKLNGTGTYFTTRYAWPTGYIHYLEEHQVEPTPGFVMYIKGL